MAIIIYEESHNTRYIRIVSGDDTYQDSPENFRKDYGTAMPDLPYGEVVRVYQPGSPYIHYTLTQFGNKTMLGENWSFGQTLLSALSTLITTKEARTTSTLVNEKTFAKQRIDDTAEEARLRYITTGAGQAMAYQEKADEATDYIASGYPTGSPVGSPIGTKVGSPISLPGYPFIEAEVIATGKSPKQVADDIIAQRTAWVGIGAKIEQERLGGKKAVDEALDGPDVIIKRNEAIAKLDAI